MTDSSFQSGDRDVTVARIPGELHTEIKNRFGTALIGYLFEDGRGEVYGAPTHFFPPDDCVDGVFPDGTSVRIWTGSDDTLRNLCGILTQRVDGAIIILIGVVVG